MKLKRHSNQFFRKGIAGGWKDDLTTSQVELAISKHQDVMQALGYLDEKNCPRY